MITPTRDFETIQQQCPGITRGNGRLPAAWWVGTEKTIPLRDKLIEKRKTAAEKLGTLTESVDGDPSKTWKRDGFLMGFTPLDLDNPHKALRAHKDYEDMWVPNKRSKAGKELDAAMEEWNRHSRPDQEGHLPGYSGRCVKYEAGQMYVAYPHLIADSDMYPVLTLAQAPEDKGADVTIDPKLWERMPVSWLARIIEETP